MTVFVLLSPFFYRNKMKLKTYYIKMNLRKKIWTGCGGEKPKTCPQRWRIVQKFLSLEFFPCCSTFFVHALTYTFCDEIILSGPYCALAYKYVSDSKS